MYILQYGKSAHPALFLILIFMKIAPFTGCRFENYAHHKENKFDVWNSSSIAINPKNYF